MGIVLRKSFKGDHFWIPPIQKQIADSLPFMTKDEIEANCCNYDRSKHVKMVKLDAMFFSANEAPCDLIG